MQEYRFARTRSVYSFQPDDPQAVALNTAGLAPDENGVIDVTHRLQTLLDSVKQQNRRGVVLIPSGAYSVSETVYIPRAVRMIGFGPTRPKFILKANTPGFQEAPAGDKGKAAYMFWFTGNMPKVDGRIDDANPGTFYSALSNIDFEIQPGNPAAVAVRAHFAQHCFVSHCVFDIGGGKAGIYDVGNEMEDLIFLGGSYGIYTTKCSPGWPFALVESAFVGQREAAVWSQEGGLTFSHVEFRDVPAADIVMDGYYEKLFWKDCAFENISGPALQISRDESSMTQINLRNVWCNNVPQLLLGKETGQAIAGEDGAYLISELSFGDRFTLGGDEPVREAVCTTRPAGEFPGFPREISDLPPQDAWVNARGFGAIGNGKADDTAALQAALDTGRPVFLPQGIYLVSDTLHMREGGALFGLNPASTQLAIAENSPAWAGIGPPKAVLETSRGWQLVSGIGIDTAARNPRAVGCKWTAAAGSYMNDVKFVGGHGQIGAHQEYVPVYNPSRTGDYDPDRPWDSQYWSLWITDNGGGTFKDIWSASPYAEAGFFVSETSTPGVMYQISVEHHVRHEILMRNVSNWQFLCMQTEEEVAEGSYCQPYELTGCHDLLFANIYAFRVIWVDNPYPTVVRAWDCGDIQFLNCHNYTQMKYTIENLYIDMNTGEKAPVWQAAKLVIPPRQRLDKLPKSKGELATLITGLDCADAMVEAPDGSVYICDSRLSRIYRWDPAAQVMTLVTSQHHRPLSLGVDADGRLLVAVEYKPVKHSVADGVEELEHDEFYGNTDNSSFYMFYKFNRRVRVIALDPKAPETSLELLPVAPVKDVNPEIFWYPLNQWCDFGGIRLAFGKPEELCCPAPDGRTAVAYRPALSRATGLTPLQVGEDAYLVDEYNKCIVKGKVEEGFALTGPEIIAQRGEYGFALTGSGDSYVPDGLLYRFRDGRRQEAIRLPDRPANVLVSRDGAYLYITARREVYALRLEDDSKHA